MEKPRYTYNGEEMTEYEASQKQRHIERKMRRWKREYKAMEAAGQPTVEASAKIAQWREIEKDFLRQTGLKLQSDRSQNAGFGKSEAAKAAAVSRRIDSFKGLVGIRTASGVSVTEVSRHFGVRAVERGVSRDGIENALTIPLKVGNIKTDEKGQQSQGFVGKFTTVNINPVTGNLITAWKTSSKEKGGN